MFGWFSAANRARFLFETPQPVISCASASGSTLIATSRPSRVSRARYTSPIPPAPASDNISYGPSLAPAVSAIDARNYSS